MRDKCAEEFKTLMILQEKNRRKQPDWNITYYSRRIQLDQQLEQVIFTFDQKNQKYIQKKKIWTNYQTENNNYYKKTAYILYFILAL